MYWENVDDLDTKIGGKKSIELKVSAIKLVTKDLSAWKPVE